MERNTQIRLAHQLAKKTINTLGALALSKGYSPSVCANIPHNRADIYIDFAYYSLGVDREEDGRMLYHNSFYFHIEDHKTRAEALAAFVEWHEWWRRNSANCPISARNKN